MSPVACLRLTLRQTAKFALVITHRRADKSLSWVAGPNANMGKNSRVKLKREGGQIMGRKSATKTNFGRVQVGGHSMNPGE